jgi:hypothetical protein
MLGAQLQKLFENRRVHLTRETVAEFADAAGLDRLMALELFDSPQ